MLFLTLSPTAYSPPLSSSTPMLSFSYLLTNQPSFLPSSLPPSFLLLNLLSPSFLLYSLLLTCLLTCLKKFFFFFILFYIYSIHAAYALPTSNAFLTLFLLSPYSLAFLSSSINPLSFTHFYTSLPYFLSPMLSLFFSSMLSLSCTHPFSYTLALLLS